MLPGRSCVAQGILQLPGGYRKQSVMSGDLASGYLKSEVKFSIGPEASGEGKDVGGVSGYSIRL